MIFIFLIIELVGSECSNCFPQHCKTYNPETPNPSAECIQQSCQGQQNTIPCSVCDDGYEFDEGYYCFEKLSNCKDTDYDTTLQRTKCKQCDAQYNQTGLYCWEQILNCKKQTEYTCNECEQNYKQVKFNETRQVCVNGILDKNCTYYYNSKELNCSKCIDSTYQIAIDNKCYKKVQYCTTLKKDGLCDQPEAGYDCLNNEPFCYKQIAYCQSSQTQYQKETQSTYCQKCLDGYSYTDNQLCKSNINNCNLFNSDFTQCLKCENNFNLIDNLCQSCNIKYCKSCQDSKVFTKICQTCFDSYVKGTNSLTCIGKCENSNSQLSNCVLCTNQSCTQCKGGYFVNTQGKCTQCQQKFANCDECLINKCSSCSLNYYYDNIKQYCYSCSQFNVGCKTCLNTINTGASNNIQCQKCLDGYYLSYDFQCILCTQQIANCLKCQNLGNEIKCTDCLEGYFFKQDENGIYCLDCTQSPINLDNCQVCAETDNKYSCNKCRDGYYLQDSQCLQCQSLCTTCDQTQACTKCSTQYILYNGTCTQDTNSFSLTSTTTSDNSLAYTNIVIKQESLGQYNVMGSLNTKGYFCQSDKQCNMYGRCLLIQCKCIQNIFGSRCQYTSTTDFTKLQSDILSYLITQTNYDANFIEILSLLSDTTYTVTESTLKAFQTVLEKFINIQFDSKYFSIIGAISKNIYSKETIAQQKLTNFDQSLLKAIIKQTESMRISEIQNTTGPFHKQILGKFDLNSDDSYQQFKSNFVQSYGQCDNEKKFLSPQIYFTADNLAEIKLMQTDAQTPLIFNQMHLYYQNHRSSGQTINSTISRIQFIKNGSLLSSSGLNYIIVVPKNDQYYADLHENNVCVQWNEDKQIWENTKATLLKCKYYTVCSVNTFGDFGTYIQIIKNTTVNQSSLSDILYINTDFEFVKTVQNSAFAISMTLFGLFFVMLTLLCILYKRPKKIKKKQQSQNIYDTAQSGFMLDQQDTSRQNQQQPQRQKKKFKNFWSVYPINAIFTATTLEFSLQKLSLYILQIQMYVTFTSIYLSSLPFKFGMLTAYYLLVVIQTWITNYLYGGLALAFRKKKKGKVLGFYWVLWFILFFGNMIIGIWQMYGLQFKFDMYLLVGVIIEFVLDSIFCDLFLTYLYQSLFIEDVVGIFKIIKFKGYYEQ